MQKNLSNKKLVAAGHQFAANISADTPLIDMAKMVSELATQLDVALVRGDKLQKQREAAVVWHDGSPAIAVGTSQRFWVTHKLNDGSLKVTDLIFFNFPEPEDEDEFCDAEMTTPDGEPYWPEGWHDLCTHPDFDYYYQKSELNVLAYAEFTEPAPAKDGV
ncbi:hypothetical protein [Pantoea dispersa]|uniref:hypothetical protein n=1 Tax=Pantoea dispersa TaxID=59814 RepID=UPI0021C7F043|nr:hypothetical protein [Pantoea dispersa]UXO69953.1 hypothetical protein N7977_08120 [Pantoea dispersa]